MTLNPFKPFSLYLRPHRRRIVAGLVLLTCAQAASTTIPMLMKWAVDTAQAGVDVLQHQVKPAGTMTGSATGDVALYAIIILGLALAQMGLQMGARWCLNSTSRFVEYDIRKVYFRHLLILSLSYFQRTRTGDLMARATNDVEAIREFLGFGVRMLFDAALALSLSLVVMCTIDWRLALYALLPMPVLALIMNRVAAKMHHGFREVQEQFSAISARVQENLSGMRVVKAYVQREAEIEMFRELNRAYMEKNRRLIHIRSFFFPLTFLLSGISLAIVLWIGGHQVLRGMFTLGDFVAFNAYLTKLIFPMVMVGWMIDRYQRGLASMNRVNEILNEEPEIRDCDDYGYPAPTPTPTCHRQVPPHYRQRPEGRNAECGMRSRKPNADLLLEIRGEVEFRKTNVTYNGEPVLREINLHIPAGGTLAVVGRVGSGKTTLARLIPRLIQAGEGQVLVDGIPVEQISLQTLRSAIGYVPQETFLFSDTLRENIALGVKEATEEDLIWATEMSQLSTDLADFPQGMDTLIGERGVTLSGGQKQRTALARAVIRCPKILILDDAMASVDTHTEEEILKRLRGEMAKRTMILISHRISTVKDAEQIVVLDEGQIVEQGTHDELVAQGGIYAEMYQRQQLTQELEEL